MNKPRALRPGDTLGLLAPSGALRDPEFLPRYVTYWQEKGYRVVVGDSCTARHGNYAGDDALRAGDINRFFSDDAIDAIFCVRGGCGAARLLPRIDFESVRRHPKIFVGYSDITALHSALNRYGNLITFHGPMGDLATGQEGCDLSYADLARALTSPEGWPVLNPPGYPLATLVPGQAHGVLTGGNLTLIAHSLGTAYAPDFAGKLLFLEDVDERAYRVDEMLVNLLHAGALDACAGIILGEFTNCVIEHPGFGLTLDEIFAELLLPLNKPILQGLRVGHCVPKLTLPFGTNCLLDATARTLDILGSAVC